MVKDFRTGPVSFWGKLGKEKKRVNEESQK
jgi:hypothetical protein